MRRYVLAGATLAVAAVAYYVWPLLGARHIAEAAMRHDTAEVMRRVDMPALRRSLTRQILHAVLEQNRKFQKLSAIGRSLAGSVGASVADAYVESVLTPENITALLDRGTVGEAGSPTRLELPPLTAILAGDPFSVFGCCYFDGVTSYVVMLGRDENAFGLRLHLHGLRWYIAGLDLPAVLTDRIAREINARQHKT